jgi:hypothetical protein
LIVITLSKVRSMRVAQLRRLTLRNKFLVLCLAAAMTSAVSNADTFTFSFAGGAITSSGTITATAVASNTSGVVAADTYEITGITGTFIDTSNGISGNITGLYSPISYVTPVTAAHAATTSGGLSYDDLFFPLGNSPADCPGYPFSGGDFDSLGVAFTVSGGYVGEFFSNGALPNAGILTAAADANSTGRLDDPNGGTENSPQGVVGSFTATTPEPSTVFLVVAGLTAAGIMRRRLTGWR